jgi:hypothetical protein
MAQNIGAEFSRLSVFGTLFEVTTRYTDLQPVGMGAFGYVNPSPFVFHHLGHFFGRKKKQVSVFIPPSSRSITCSSLGVVPVNM